METVSSEDCASGRFEASRLNHELDRARKIHDWNSPQSLRNAVRQHPRWWPAQPFPNILLIRRVPEGRDVRAWFGESAIVDDSWKKTPIEWVESLPRAHQNKIRLVKI